LFIGIANAFINIAASTYFIYTFNIQGLPYAYIGIAIVLFILNFVYEKVEHKLTPIQLLKFIVLFSSAIIFLFWAGLLVFNKTTLIFLLLVWSTVFYMITGYAYWGLVSLLFNIRESKRVFSIVGAGDIPAKLLGYLAAPFIIKLIGLNILGFALAFLAISLLLINNIVKKKSIKSIKVRHQHHAPRLEATSKLDLIKSNFFLKYRLIFTISVLSILSYNVFNLVDYTYFAEVKSRFHDISTLASFIAVFFAIGRVIALILKLVFTSRVIERIGVIACLMITPAVLFIFSMAILPFKDTEHYGLYFFGAMALMAEVLRSTIQEPAFFILFQPLSEQYRLKGHIIAKGYMLPPSLIIVGLSLIIMRSLGIELSLRFTTSVLLINLALWALIVLFIKKEYITALHKSIARGIFNGEDVHIYDHKTINILLEKAESEREADNIYALKLLENASYSKISELLHNSLYSGKTELRRYALLRLEARKEIETDLLKELIPEETDNEIKEKLISILCKLDHSYLHTLSNHLAEQEYSIRKTIIIDLLDQSEFDDLFKAGNEINNLISSSNPKERELALEIIAELKNIKFTAAIEKLMSDDEPSVKRNAIIAACKLKNKKLLPVLISMLENPSHHYMVLQGMLQYGDSLFEDLMRIPEVHIEKNKTDLIKIAAKTKGIHSTTFLLNSLLHARYTEKVIDSLWNKGFQAESVEDVHHFQALLTKYLNNGTEKLHLYPNINHFVSSELIKTALDNEIRNDVITAFKVCAILYHKREINRLLELIESSDRSRIYNAMEMMGLVLPKKTSIHLNNLLDYILDPGANKRNIKLVDAKTFFNKVINTHSYNFTPWTKAVCLYCYYLNNEIDLLRNVKGPVEVEESPILIETKEFISKAIEQPLYANY
jgi:ATP/ADP translocase